MSSNIEIVKQFQQFMAQGEQAQAFAMITDDAVWHSDEIGAPWSGIHEGINAIKEHFQNISGTTQQFKREIKQCIEQGDLVIELGGLSCILNKTNLPFETEYVCLYGVKDKKIFSYRIFEDSLRLYRAYFPKTKENLGLQFKDSVATIAPNEMSKVIASADIEKHFPAPAPGAVNIFSDNHMSVGMVKTQDYPSYPHSNDYDEVHYVLKGTAKFRSGGGAATEIKAGDVVYVKTPEEHEWFDCSADFQLIFVQAKP
ncbi:MAG: nuclear transport factor 2 family protein [Coxiellaceae bacterium]|nr:nuclear transport factor 2 family protein [Coxiellaceae bacterium]